MIKALNPASFCEVISKCMESPTDSTIPYHALIVLEDDYEAAEFTEAFLEEQRNFLISKKFVLRENVDGTTYYNAEIILENGIICVVSCDGNVTEKIRRLFPEIVFNYDTINLHIALKHNVDCLYSESIDSDKIYMTFSNEFDDGDDDNEALTEFLKSFKQSK